MQVPYIKFGLLSIKGSNFPISVPSLSCELRLQPAKDQKLLKQDLALAEVLKEHFVTLKELEGLLDQLTVGPGSVDSVSTLVTTIGVMEVVGLLDEIAGRPKAKGACGEELLVMDDIGGELLGSCEHAVVAYSGLVDAAAVQSPTGRPPQKARGSPTRIM
ncbi:hypothetical protein EYC80_006394 [Monilinia laxa]|uniref:Uncharacterized protein n=1 Tax=Monilinia laxa TaxID=61186 RepID=A0A5N6JUP7_MONLA|nr:hypothetical protein EYC80_006394 [Monilinia laxa]